MPAGTSIGVGRRYYPAGMSIRLDRVQHNDRETIVVRGCHGSHILVQKDTRHSTHNRSSPRITILGPPDAANYSVQRARRSGAVEEKTEIGMDGLIIKAEDRHQRC